MNAMNDTEKEKTGSSLYFIILSIFMVISILYLPLLLSLVESAFFGSRYVENFCRQIGIHDELTWLYRNTFFFVN